jgi:conjugal transfer pilus assembly protein TraE
MKRANYVSQIAELRSSVSFWVGLTILSVLSNVLFGAWLVMANPREQHTIIPVNVDRPFSVRDGVYSKEYVEMMATWFVSQVHNYVPDTFDYQIDTFLKYSDPETYGALKTKLAADRDWIKKEQISSSVFIQRVKIRGMSAFVEGIVRLRVGLHKVEDKQKAWMVVITSLPNGRAAVSELKEVKDEEEYFDKLAAVTF